MTSSPHFARKVGRRSVADVHILEKVRDEDAKTNTKGKYHAVMHFSVPVGNNSANLTWKSVFLAAGLTGPGKSVLTEGTGPGQITVVESGQITLGDVIEIEGIVAVVNGGSLEDTVVNLRNQAKAELFAKYDRWGMTI